MAPLVVPVSARAAASRDVTPLALLDSYTRYSAGTRYVHRDGREHVPLDPRGRGGAHAPAPSCAAAV